MNESDVKRWYQILFAKNRTVVQQKIDYCGEHREYLISDNKIIAELVVNASSVKYYFY